MDRTDIESKLQRSEEMSTRRGVHHAKLAQTRNSNKKRPKITMSVTGAGLAIEKVTVSLPGTIYKLDSWVFVLLSKLYPNDIISSTMVGWTLANTPLQFQGLSQSSMSFAVPLGLAASTIFASKLVNLRSHSISPLQVAAIASLAVGTLFPGVFLAPPMSDYHDYSATIKDSSGLIVLGRSRALHIGLGIANAGLYLLEHNVLRHQDADSSARMYPIPTASRSGSEAITSFAASDGRRSSLRSNCPPGECTVNNGHGLFRRGGIRRNAGGSGSGGGGGHGQPPLGVPGKSKDGMRLSCILSKIYRLIGFSVDT